MEETNWFTRIMLAREDGSFSDKDIIEASSWVTCACGEQVPRSLRNVSTGTPKDDKLVFLGLDFAGYVVAHNFDSAKATLHLIEARVQELLFPESVTDIEVTQTI